MFWEIKTSKCRQQKNISIIGRGKRVKTQKGYGKPPTIVYYIKNSKNRWVKSNYKKYLTYTKK